MVVSETERDMPKRNRLVPPDSALNNRDQGQECVVEDKIVKSDSRPDPQPQISKPREEKNSAKDDNKASKPLPKWPLALGALVIVALVGVVLWLIFEPRPDVRTDDAYITVHYASIAPRISGQISSVLVDDNDTVKAGQILVTLIRATTRRRSLPPKQRWRATLPSSKMFPPLSPVNRQSSASRKAT
jgi:biotin carboxyl carrier protein